MTLWFSIALLFGYGLGLFLNHVDRLHIAGVLGAGLCLLFGSMAWRRFWERFMVYNRIY